MEADHVPERAEVIVRRPPFGRLFAQNECVDPRVSPPER